MNSNLTTSPSGSTVSLPSSLTKLDEILSILDTSIIAEGNSFTNTTLNVQLLLGFIPSEAKIVMLNCPGAPINDLEISSGQLGSPSVTDIGSSYEVSNQHQRSPFSGS